jgi:hypothetical protein
MATDARGIEDFFTRVELQLLCICNAGQADEADRKEQLIHRGGTIRGAFCSVKGVYVGEENHSHSRQIVMQAKAAIYVHRN